MDLNALTAKENIRVSCWCYFCLCLRWNYVSLNGYILLNLTFNASFWNFTIFPVFFIRERKFEKLLNILVSRVKWARIIYDIYYWGYDFKQHLSYIYIIIYIIHEWSQEFIKVLVLFIEFYLYIRDNIWPPFNFFNVVRHQRHYNIFEAVKYFEFFFIKRFYGKQLFNNVSNRF